MIFDDPKSFSCPYCGSDNDLVVDPSGGKRQKLILDCMICCQPIVVELSLSDNVWDVLVKREND